MFGVKRRHPLSHPIDTDLDPGRGMVAKRTGALAAQIAGALRQKIVSGTLPAGTPLRQDRLAGEFGTSRMPVREALHSLQQEGLVHLEPNRGAVVAALDPAEVREIYEMRAAAETLALKTAIPELTDRHLDHVGGIVEEGAGGRIGDFGQANRTFHLTLYAPCGRPRLLAHIAGLTDLADRYLRITVRTLDYAARSDAEHRGIVDACRRRDADLACDRLRHHIEAAGAALTDLLERRVG